MIYWHGAARIVQYPYFVFYSVVPLAMYTVDQLYASTTSLPVVPIDLQATGPVSSSVLRMAFKNGPLFSYKAGMWMKIAIATEFGFLKYFPEPVQRFLAKYCGTDNYVTTYHSFTISSAPSDEMVTVHIRAVGPFTKKLYNLYSRPKHEIEKKFRKLYINGPYGEGFQDWDRRETLVLFGLGTGITPTLSVVRDFVHRLETNDWNLVSQKIYVVWVANRIDTNWRWVRVQLTELEERAHAAAMKSNGRYRPKPLTILFYSTDPLPQSRRQAQEAAKINRGISAIGDFMFSFNRQLTRAITRLRTKEGSKPEQQTFQLKFKESDAFMNILTLLLNYRATGAMSTDGVNDFLNPRFAHIGKKPDYNSLFDFISHLEGLEVRGALPPGQVLPEPRTILACVCGPPSAGNKIKEAMHLCNAKLKTERRAMRSAEQQDSRTEVVRGWHFYASEF
eukprot:scaffold2886_cov398-Prasinococcus_capsulatus_cf.AAC.11